MSNLEKNETDFEWMLYDRIEVIKTINQMYDLDNNAYLSFSGGKDSTVLHYLLDLALPGNKIPRVFVNTGIEYLDLVKFVKDLASNDERFHIIQPQQNIKTMLETVGYPFKNKQHSHNLGIYQHGGMSTTPYKYLNGDSKIFKCPENLRYQFTDDFKIKVSDRCCIKLKKQPFEKWEKANKRSIALTGMRNGEGGVRQFKKGCAVFDNQSNLKKFHPLNPVSEAFEDWFIEKHDIKLCKLYYPPYNFKRTGCKGCPFTRDLQEQLNLMEELLPNEKIQCETIWKPVYEEYRRIGYRLDSEVK